jgi:hypothetical protein
VAGADLACEGVTAGGFRRDVESRDVSRGGARSERKGAFVLEHGGRRLGADGVVCRGCLY